MQEFISIGNPPRLFGSGNDSSEMSVPDVLAHWGGVMFDVHWEWGSGNLINALMADFA